MLATPAAVLADLISLTGLAIFFALSIWLAVVDWREHRLPNELVAAAGLTALASQLAQTALTATEPTGLDLAPFIRSVTAAAVCFVLYLALHLASRTQRAAGMGAGDVKLSAVLGLYLGWVSADTAVLGIAAGFVLASVFSLILIATKRGNKRSRVAFGPWMLAGAWLGLTPATLIPSIQHLTNLAR